MVQGGTPVATGLTLVLILSGVLAGCLGGQDLSTGDPDDQDRGPFSDTDVFEGEYDTETWRLPERGPHTELLQQVTLLESPVDGADIQVYVMRPETDDETVPVILQASPYIPPLDEDADLSGNDFFVDFVSHGYAFALVAVRGTGNSGGCMDLMGEKEQADIDAAITWLATQDWSNGNVGMFGGSYDGSTQWTAAATGNPHLKTIIPLAAIPDLFSFMVRNGTWMTWTPVSFSAIYWALYGPGNYNPTTGRSLENTLEQLLCPESFEGLLVSPHTALTGQRDPLGWWAERDWRADVEANYQGSIYLIHGLRDLTVEPHTAYPWMSTLEENGITVKHTLGPWGHELPYRADSLEIIKRWYDRWLKEDESVDIGPAAQIQDNLGHWRSEPTWPPQDTIPLHLYLGEETLTKEPTHDGETPIGPMAPVHDPVEWAQGLNWMFKWYEDPMMEVCPQCPVFETPPLDEELRFAGSPRLHIEVTPTGPGGHVTAILHIEHEDKETDRVAFTQMDLRYPQGGESAQTVTPGERMQLHMEFQPTDVAVPAGSKLTLTLHQGSYGLRAPSTPTYPVVLHTGEASALILDTFTRGADAFHDAPDRVGPDSPPR